MENLINWLLNYAFDHGIGYVLTDELPSSIPHTASAKHRMILINKHYGNPQEMPFAIAHEIGHVMDGDLGIRYYCSAIIHDKAEYRANVFGIQLIQQYCDHEDIHISNAVKFCEVFGVPSRLDYIVALNLSKS
ncbi:ImmA/IrrE family metallo-endopeptidase [Limosilactobacillus difficilis]|uniref:ImmA/IrrE family metallo-endopeptidase n=1 Tax=Limosilactobacillus difficilis TaxID=2991838 RepID=UPI0024BA28F0|nr:ImmA/IrrE family metallo-endopeptidase [Limosilactobacillus difficilis]